MAMALNGGVSLAVWMGGCAVEIDCARRAHLGPENVAGGDEKRPPPAHAGGVRRHSARATSRSWWWTSWPGPAPVA